MTAAPFLQEGPVIPDGVYTIWIITLLAAVLVVLPLIVFLLQRVLNAAKYIARYMGEMRDAGVGIAGNTQHIAALDDTVEIAGRILDTAGMINTHAETIKTTLSARVGGNGKE
ncbi:MAG TPA: hypothetical protein VMN57_06900 [Anaerolineales bacterium]|nr:hypothetical protein [Anaerolineales bacterium]